MSKVNDLQLNGQLLPTTKSKCGFTQISNAVLLDEQLSFKARGILALLLSRPSNWRIYLSEIADRSNKDGKKAIQSGFKELLAFGYIQLESFLDEETGHFKGKGYTICSKKLNRQRPFRSILKTDHPKTGQSSKRIVLKDDPPKTASYSNKEGSNTKNRNTKKQQHQKEATHKTDDVGFEKIEKDINTYYPTLLNDASWQSLYISTPINTKRQLSTEEMYLLLLHFKNTSLKSGATYTETALVKKHFANWFQLNLSKNQLLQYIQEGKKVERQTKTIILPLITAVNGYFDMLLQRQCASINQVLNFKEKLTAANKRLTAKSCFFSQANERTSISTLQSDISKMLIKLNNAAAKEQLIWFCQKGVSISQ